MPHGRRIPLAGGAVHHRFRGLGLGTLLLKALAGVARDRGYARLTVRLEGAAVGFGPSFERLGFAPISETLALDPTGFEV